jgi:cyclic pyranopterin phosphate synthase
VYCMPKEIFGKDFQFLPRAEILSFEEIERLVRIFVSLGVQKIRLTGGEPLVRRDLERLVEKLAKIGDLDLTLTTNGSLLSQKARSLADAGLRRVTVSLDSLDDATFKKMNDSDFPVAKVLAGIEAARAAGLAPIKINMVTKRGVNESSIVPMARYFKGTGMTLRFIEFMDVGSTNGWRLDDVVPAREIVAMIDREMPLEPVVAGYRGEVAARYRYRDGGGEIGVISSVTQPFCADCTRARLSADGSLYTCLFATQGHDLRALVRSQASDAEITNAIAAVWTDRTDRYSDLRSEATAGLHKIEMSFIGG